ncbi:hypothetical protein DKP78_16480, partial [Enterococcus faecium]
ADLHPALCFLHQTGQEGVYEVNAEDWGIHLPGQWLHRHDWLHDSHHSGLDPRNQFCRGGRWSLEGAGLGRVEALQIHLLGARGRHQTAQPLQMNPNKRSDRLQTSTVKEKKKKK